MLLTVPGVHVLNTLPLKRVHAFRLVLDHILAPEHALEPCVPHAAPIETNIMVGLMSFFVVRQQLRMTLKTFFAMMLALIDVNILVLNSLCALQILLSVDIH